MPAHPDPAAGGPEPARLGLAVLRDLPAAHPDLPARLHDLPPGTWMVGGLMGASGVVHLARPETFVALMPPWLGPPVPWILASGVAELACAAGLLTRQRWAPGAAATTLAIIWVGNVYFAFDASGQEDAKPAVVALAWLRVPLQLPLIRWALRSPTRAPRARRSPT